MICGFSFLSTSQEWSGEATPVKKTTTAKKARYPVAKTVPETVEEFKDEKPLDLKDPENVNTKVEYDPETGNYYIVTKMGEEAIGTPITLTAAEYLKYQQEPVLQESEMQKILQKINLQILLLITMLELVRHLTS